MENSPADQHRAQASARLTTLGQRFFQFIEFDDSEELIKEIRKHPFGLLLVQLTGLLITLVIVGGSLLLGSNLSVITGDNNNITTIHSGIIACGFVLGIVAIIGTQIAVVLYRSNVIFITSHKISQVMYTSIFNRKLSQLSIGDVQDVTVTQSGIFPRLLNYGTLIIETAGEQQNYTFTFVPKPYEASKAIVGAHEENLERFGN